MFLAYYSISEKVGVHERSRLLLSAEGFHRERAIQAGKGTRKAQQTPSPTIEALRIRAELRCGHRIQESVRPG
jgi:hypothetical protein